MERPDRGVRYWAIRKNLENLGYKVEGCPLEGQYDEFCDGLQEALDTVEQRAVSVRKFFRTRAWSKRTLEQLHRSLPAPSFFVQISRERQSEIGLERLRDWPIYKSDKRAQHMYS
ncbi:hypothetical protein [Leisingera sp. JC1]|uniref:hypothetical protein n=1 Tax=Leisingera sp. JC1 TaxID=1855282 RepID=UPI0015862BFA|nr:hypothetical protein [Leisingera sp. JC1]